jgi:ATP/maltotriose-dependent transcriptional regulator MalT
VDHPGVWRSAWFAQEKFRPTILPANAVSRSVLHDRLQAGGGQRLTVVVGPAGSGKSILLPSWAAARPSAPRRGWRAIRLMQVQSGSGLRSSRLPE